MGIGSNGVMPECPCGGTYIPGRLDEPAKDTLNPPEHTWERRLWWLSLNSRLHWIDASRNLRAKLESRQPGHPGRRPAIGALRGRRVLVPQSRTLPAAGGT